MRKSLPIFVTLALIGAFFVYLHFQPKVRPSQTGVAAPTETESTATTTNSGVLVGPGTGAWVTQFDRATGKLAYQFRAVAYDHRPDGTYRVNAPEIEFFLSDGQIVNVKGTDGIVRVAPEADRATMTGAPPEPPRYGTMRNVVIKMYGSQADEAAGNANMTLTMTNAAFDNDTFRIFTEEYVDESGHVVHADEVPVTVRAKQYDFDGSGLVLYWNDLDRRLKSLEIEHGTQLTIYDSSGYEVVPVSAASPKTELADASPTLPAGAIAGDSQPATESSGDSSGDSSGESSGEPAAPKHRYIATFYEDVRIEQNGVPLIRAPEKMEVDFAPREGGNNPATEPQAPPSAELPSTPIASSTAPATQPGSPAVVGQPIEIYWKGKMEMVPNDAADAEPLAAGNSIVRFFGDIVRLQQRSQADGITTQAVCSQLTYHTADASAKLSGSPSQLVQIRQTKSNGSETDITGPLVLYSREQGVAMVQGAGSADLPDDADAKGAVHAVWDKSCIVHLDPNSGRVLRVKTIDLSGHVAVDHPKFNLMSDDLGLVFVPGAPSTDATAPEQLQLGQVLATGNAVCVVHETEQRTRSISSDKLQLNTDRTPDGRLFAKTILADGSVHALQDQETLGAEHLRVELLPAVLPDRPKAADAENQEGDVQLDTLEATENVRVTGKNSTAASGNRLTIVMTDGHPKVTLYGSKDQPAVAADKDSTISGPVILLSAADQTSSVNGPGTLSTTAQAAAPPPAVGEQSPENPQNPPPNANARPIKMSWQQSADLDGKANLIRVLQDVNIESKDASGTVDLAHANELNLLLTDQAPATGAAHPAATTQPAEIGGPDDFNFMRNKQVQSFILIKKAQIESSAADQAGKVLRRSDIFSDRIEYNVISRKLLVPQAGKMLVEDHRPAAAADDPNANPVTGRGVTAFKWDKELYYDEAKRTAEISGGVVIVHRDDGPKPNPIHIDADTATAEFQASNPDENQSDDATAQLQIGHLTVAGHVTVVTESATIRCGEADYDPTNFQLICSAADEGAATLLDAQHDNAEFSQIVIDTRTNLIVKAVNVSMHHQGD
jgi:hypothetical protein